MGRNLSNLFISQSYQFITQISGSELQDGLGNTITSLNITASNAVSASYSNASTSASYAAVATSSSYAINASNAVSASFATTASYALNAGVAVNTGSLLVTASAVNNVITFTKGDGSTFPVTVATGSTVSSSFASTASLALNNVLTASSTNATITYTKGDGTTFTNVINNVVNATSASFATSASQAVSASQAQTAVSSSFATSASVATSASFATSASQAVSSSFAISSSVATSASFAISASQATTASFAQNIANGLSPTFANVTASNVMITGTASVALLYTQTISSSVIFSSGSNLLGDSSTLDTQTLIGIVKTSGSFSATGSAGFTGGDFKVTDQTRNAEFDVDFFKVKTVNGTQFTGSVSSLNGFTGSLAGTASFATSASQAVSSSFATTASFALNVTPTNTGSLLTTASAAGNVITFTKGDASTFNVTVATGSFSGPAYGFQGLSSGSNVPLFTFSDTSSATGIPISFTASIGTPIFIYDQPYNSGSIYTSYNLSFTTAQYANDNRGGQGNLIFGGYDHRVGNGGGFGNSLTPQAMTMLGGRENFFGVGSSGKGWVMIGGYQNNLGGTYGSSQAEDGPVLIGGRNNTLGASTGGGLFAGYENTQQGNTDASVIIGGRNNTLWADAQFAAIVGASNSNQKSGYGGIIGGYINTNQGDYNAYIYGGQENEIKLGSYNNNTIVGGQNNTIYAIPNVGPSPFEPGTTIIGGRFNSISGSTHFSTIVGGYQNLMLHSGSVILGGRAITSSAHNTTFVPNLNVSGSITAPNATTFVQNTTDTYTSSAAVQQIVTLTQAEYNAIGSPDANTFYVISGSLANATVGSNTFTGNQVFSGSVRGVVISGSTTSNTSSLDFSAGNFFTLNTNNVLNTHIVPTNVQSGQTVNLELTFPATSSAISFPSYVKQPSGSAYSPSGANTTDILTFIVFNSGSVYLSSVKNMI